MHRGGPVTPAYATFPDAQRRVEVLKRIGIWPGIVEAADGTCQLTYDPPGLA